MGVTISTALVAIGLFLYDRRLAFDDGMQQIDVKFFVGMTEYNYDIDANTGTIVDFDAEIDD